MAECWTLYVVPTEPEFVPTPEQSSALVAFLSARTGVEDGYTVGDRTGLDAKAAGQVFAAAAEPRRCEVPFCRSFRSDTMFGWNPLQPDDMDYWADGFAIEVTEVPKRFADPTLRRVRGRKARLSISFFENKGWMGDPAQARKAFRDAEFLPGLERLLGVPVEVVAISS